MAKRQVTMKIPVKDLSKHTNSGMATLVETQVQSMHKPGTLYVVESVTYIPNIPHSDMFEVGGYSRG
eukprot:6900409-Pyramimonas_sp.AAC.1